MGIRKLAERLARGRRILRHIVVDGKRIELFVSPDAQLKYLKKSGAWDDDLVKLAHSHVAEGDDVWDIGSNVGVFAFAAAARSKTGKVYAVEPDTFLVECIRQSRARNGLRNVEVLPVAVSKSDGFAEFLVAERGRASNALAEAGGRSQMGGVRDSFIVPTVSGKSMAERLESRPSFIKIDVEGAELAVLEGISDVLKTAKPVVYVELSAESLPAATALFEDVGYRQETSPQTEHGLGNHLFVPA